MPFQIYRPVEQFNKIRKSRLLIWDLAYAGDDDVEDNIQLLRKIVNPKNLGYKLTILYCPKSPNALAF